MSSFRSLVIVIGVLLPLAGCAANQAFVDRTADCTQPDPVRTSIQISPDGNKCSVDIDELELCRQRTNGPDQVQWCSTDTTNYDIDFSTFLGVKTGSGNPHVAPFDHDDTNPIPTVAGTTLCTAWKTPPACPRPPCSEEKHKYAVRKNQRVCKDPKVIFK